MTTALHSPRVAIVGGGISGLAAAHRLTEIIPYAKVSLYEASSRLGGVLETIEHDGFLIERSADNFLTAPPAAIELCRRLGLENELVRTDESRRRAFVVRNGRLVPIPEGFYLMSPRKLLPILRSPLLSLAGKLRLLAEPFVLRSTATDDESVASFARRRLGNEVFERFVQPLVAGIYTADPDKLSMAATMPQFVEFERTRGSLLMATLKAAADKSTSGARYGLFLAPKRGLQSLVAAISERLPTGTVRLNHRVDRVEQVGRTWSVGVAERSEHDAVIIALPGPVAGAVLSRRQPALGSELGAIEYASCAVVSLGFRRRQIGHPLDGFGFVVPQVERRRIIAGSFASLKYPGRAPSEHVLIRVFIGGALQPELLNLPDAELQRIAIDELRELLQVTGEPPVTDVVRWSRSMPQYHVGHLARVARIEQMLMATPTLALAGNAYRGVGIPQCVASGEAAAERIAAALRPA